MASPFRTGSQAFQLNEHFKQGKSLTHDEATAMNIGRLAQRMQDLKNRYLELAGWCPIMVYLEPNSRGGSRARYFYKNTGSPFENKPNIKAY